MPEIRPKYRPQIRLQTFRIRMNTGSTFSKIFLEHSGKVSDKWESYLYTYDNILPEFKPKPIRLLEIGVQNGGSLEVWAKYFQAAQQIIGCDVHQDVGTLTFKDPRIRAVVGNATDPETLQTVDPESTGFDVIIDDGSHISKDIIQSFALLWPSVRPGGLYVVEDAQCSYYPEFGGSLHHPNSCISFFKIVADWINKEHWHAEDQNTDRLKKVFTSHGIPAPDTSSFATIESISFHNSIIAIRAQPDNIQQGIGHQLVRGEQEAIMPGRRNLDQRDYARINFSQAPPPAEYIKSPEEREASLQAQNHSLNQKLEFAYRAQDTLREALSRARATVSAQTPRISELESLNATKDSQLAHLHQVVTDYGNELQRIAHSQSWRLTGPLRTVGNQARRIRRALADGLRVIRARGGFTQSAAIALRTLRNESPAALMAKYQRERRMNELAYGPASSHPGSDLPTIEGGPLISIIVPTYNTPAEYLNACIRSVQNQAYPNWQLILVDDCSPNSEIRGLISAHADQDPRIESVFRKSNGHISAATNCGLEKAKGEYVTVLDHDDLLTTDALYWVAKEVLKKPDLDYIYSDEDKVSADGKSFFGPFFKPDWSPEYMLSMMYTCHMSVFRTNLLKDLGGYRSDYDGAQDYDMTLRVVAKTQNIAHIPKILYHWRVWENSTAASVDAKPYANNCQIRALENYLALTGDTYEFAENPRPGHHTVVFKPRRESLISIVIPTANGTLVVDGRKEVHIDAIIDTILSLSTYPNYEIVVVHNGDLSEEQNHRMTSHAKIRLVEYTMGESFSLAEKINQGCDAAAGEFLVIMNDDIRMITPDWMERMLGVAQRDGVGVVGAKLLFPDRKIQHAGVVLLGGLPGHAYYELPEETEGYALSAEVDRNYLAVTGACQMTPKALFQEVGGYSPRYPLNYNDVDYCLKLHQKGLRAVCLANVKMFHYEGVSKDGGRTVGEGELERFLEDWSETFPFDPYYNPNLCQRTPYGL